MKFKTRKELKKTKIEIIPMIDTMFFLLVFFMLSSLSLTKLLAMPVNLPQASNATKQNSMDFTISVTSARQIYVNNDLVQPDAVGDAILTLAGGPSADLSKASVVISADEGVPYGLVISCIDQARGVGVTHFPLAITPPATGTANPSSESHGG
jgi:biopolymer transport protein ExbD